MDVEHSIAHLSHERLVNSYERVPRKLLNVEVFQHQLALHVMSMLTSITIYT